MKQLSRLFNIFVIASLLAGAAWSSRPASPAYALSWTNKTTANGLGNNWVFDVHASGSNVYAATNGGGLSISTNGGASFTNKTTADGLGHNYVRGVHVSDSKVYVATEGGLSISTDGGASFANRTTADGLGHNLVNGAHASGENVYAATNGGGLSISTNGGASFVSKTTANGLGDNWVQGVHASGSTVCAATTSGLSISTDGGASFANRTTADGLGSNNVQGVYVSGSNVYAATTGGLSISTDGGASFTNKTTADGLGNNYVLDVHASGLTVYAATNGGGLSISTDGSASFSTDTTADGLGHNSVLGVHVSGSTVYAATGGGLSYASTSETITATFKSSSAQDGWVLESSETSNKGGTMNKTATTLNLGDDAAKRQYRAILSFNTGGLPDNATVTKVTLKVKRQGVTGGGNPVSIFKGFFVDIKKGTFGTSALQLGDFKTAANKTIGPFSPGLSSGWYKINLTTGKAQINKTGLTQIRLRFKLDDNNNLVANILKLYSGNAGAANRPQLIVEYYVP